MLRVTSQQPTTNPKKQTPCRTRPRLFRVGNNISRRQLARPFLVRSSIPPDRLSFLPPSPFPYKLTGAPIQPGQNTRAMDYDRYDAFLHHIFKQTQGDAWFRPSEDNLSAGVALRVDQGACNFLSRLLEQRLTSPPLIFSPLCVLDPQFSRPL